MNSTGTPSLFLHAADAIHGDLGMIQSEDIVMLISKSGETPEIKVLVPLIKQFGNTLIALCGNQHSYLSKESNYFIDTTVAEEACPNNLAPTSSTTAQLVIGDAMAVCLLSLKGFKPEDFAKYHPGGSLGKRLYLKVSDLCASNAAPYVAPDTPMIALLLTITEGRLGACAVVDSHQGILGIVTDGDIRRSLATHNGQTNVLAKDIMSKNPKTIDKDELAVNALHLMRENNITQLLVCSSHHYNGIIHLHDLLKEGII